MRSERSRRAPIWRWGLVAVLASSVGCAYLPFQKSHKTAADLRVGGRDSKLTMGMLQIEVLRYADGYVSSISHAADVAARRIGTREATVAGLKWKLDQATAAYADATGPNPVWNALDLAVFATVSRMIVDDAKTGEEFGDEVGSLVTVHRRLEQDAWTLVEGFLTPEQVEELKGLIVEWRKQNPGDREAVGVHFRDFAQNLGKVSQANKIKPTSIFSMLYLDPFAGLSPTTVAIEQSRELAERVVAYAERAPTLMRWQAELLALQISQQPAPREVLADADRASRSMESIAGTAQGLPALVEEQRKAAIDQFFAGVAAERSAILAELDSKEATIQSLLGQLRETMNAGGEMGKSLTATIQSLDAFVHYVSPPSDPNVPAKPGKPFDILEYGRTAGDVGGMARDMTALLRSVDQTAPAIARLSARTGDDLKGVIDHAFWRGLVLVLVLLVGSVPALLAYRALSRRFVREPRSPATRT